MVILEAIRSKQYSVPQPAGIWFLGMVISLTGIIFMGNGGVTTLTCQRPALSRHASDGICKLTSARLFDPPAQEIAITNLQEARLEQPYRNPYHIGYQVVLLTYAGEIPLTGSAPTERNWKAEITADINQFLNTPERTTLQIQLEDQVSYGVFGFLLTVTGTVTGLFGRQLFQGMMVNQQNTQI